MRGDEERGAALAAQPREEIPHPAGVPPVEARRRLVGDEKEGAESEGAGHSDPLLLTARERARPDPRAAREPHRLERLARPLLGVRVPAEGKRETHVLEHVEERKELDVLEDEPQMGETQRGPAVFVERVEVPVKEPDTPRARRLKPRSHRKERGLARTGHAQEGRPFATLEGQGHPL